MQIRGGMIGDSAGIARVQVDSYRSAYAGICSATYLDAFSYEEQEQEWRDSFELNAEEIVYVAEDDKGRIIAYALARVGDSEVPGYDCELVAIHVREKNQRMGIGRMLLWTMAKELKRLGCSSLMVWMIEANTARGFAERMGAQLLTETRHMTDFPPEVPYGWSSVEAIYRRVS